MCGKLGAGLERQINEPRGSAVSRPSVLAPCRSHGRPPPLDESREIGRPGRRYSLPGEPRGERIRVGERLLGLLMGEIPPLDGEIRPSHTYRQKRQSMTQWGRALGPEALHSRGERSSCLCQGTRLSAAPPSRPSSPRATSAPPPPDWQGEPPPRAEAGSRAAPAGEAVSRAGMMVMEAVGAREGTGAAGGAPGGGSGAAAASLGGGAGRGNVAAGGRPCALS